MKVTDEVYREYSQMIYKYLFSLTRDAHVAEEVTQETFYQAVRCADRFDGSCRFSTWLCAIAKNQLNSYRRKYSVPFGDTEKPEALAKTGAGKTDVTPEKTGAGKTDVTPEKTVLSEYGRVEILRKLHQLDAAVREVMYLRIFGDLSFAQIGEITGRTENWARVTYYRGKEKLRKELDGNE